MLNVLRTKDIPMVRGQTMPIEFTLKDRFGTRVDLTGAAAYMWVRADIKIDASIKLSSAVTAGHRIGIIFADQSGEHRGEFTATLIPSDTSGLVALGSEDPWLFDVWVVLADGTRTPVVSLSKLPLYPEATTIA